MTEKLQEILHSEIALTKAIDMAVKQYTETSVIFKGSYVVHM